MDVLPLGWRYPGGGPLFPAPSLEELAARRAQLSTLSKSARRLGTSPWTFDERKVVRQPNLSEPAEVGWMCLVAAADPQRERIAAALEPLAAHRAMNGEPLVYPASTPDWIDEGYLGLGDNRPAYVLLAGDPVHLPFSLQVDLAAAGAIVGRVAFDKIADLKAYVAKVVACEDKANDPRPQATAVVLAPEAKGDVTTYSRRFMAEPVARLLNGEANLMSVDLLGPDATAANLLATLSQSRPAIVFTASHGAGVPTTDGAKKQRKVNGAIGCEPPAGSSATDWDWLRAEDLPDAPFCPGGIVVQFACFGGGTSDRSSYAAWLGPDGSNEFDAKEPFVAALPKALLAHPDGPVAHVGHVDVAVLHGFDDPDSPVPAGGDAHPRLEPFKTLVRRAVAELTPVGFALRDLHARAASMSATIATTVDRLQQRGIEVAGMAAADRDAFLDLFIRRNDAMHFLLLGDPAARIRIDG